MFRGVGFRDAHPSLDAKKGFRDGNHPSIALIRKNVFFISLGS